MAQNRQFTGMGRNGYGQGNHNPGFTGMGRNGMGQGNHGGQAFAPPQPMPQAGPSPMGPQGPMPQPQGGMQPNWGNMQPMPRGGQGWGNSLDAIQAAAMAGQQMQPQGMVGIAGQMAGQMQPQGQGYPAQQPMNPGRQLINWMNTAESKRTPIAQYRPQAPTSPQGLMSMPPQMARQMADSMRY